MIYFLIPLWFLRQTKAVFFWLYFWQLKEYHIGRFLAHFRTEEGKRLLLNKPLILRIILFFILSFPVALMALVILYFLESFKFFYDLVRGNLKRPVLTKKIIFLLFIIFSFEIFYLFSVLFYKNFVQKLLLFDVLTPFIVSGILLLFQPLTVLLRSRIINKAKRKREKFKDLSVIGITGSYGKTSTKEFLKVILSKRFNTLSTKEHQNSEVGISNCILNDLNKGHEIFIVEMGAYNRGGIKLLCNITKPRIGILTGINEQHLATFGSQENIIKAKYELIESLPEDGTAIFNGNNEIIKNYNSKLTLRHGSGLMLSEVEALKNIRICSTKEKADMWTEDIKITKQDISFKVFSKDGDSAFFKVKLLGAQNIENILLAASCAKELGMGLKEIAIACEKIRQEQGATKLLRGVSKINIIDSTYSSNPEGVISHLDYLKTWKGKKLIIMPCLIELAQASKEVHEKIGKKIAEVCDSCIITKKECFPEIRKSAIQKGMAKENISFLEKPTDILNKVKDFSDAEDIILLEGRVSKEIIKSLMDHGV